MPLNWNAAIDSANGLINDYVRRSRDQEDADLNAKRAEQTAIAAEGRAMERFKEQHRWSDQFDELKKQRISEKMDAAVGNLSKAETLRRAGVTEEDIATGNLDELLSQQRESDAQAGTDFANYRPDSIDSNRIRAEAAAKIGDKTLEAHYRGLLGEERKFKADEARTAALDKSNLLKEIEQARKERLTDAQVAKLTRAGSGSGTGSANFQFDPEKEQKSAYALAGLTAVEVKQYNEKFDELSPEKKASIERKMQTADLYLREGVKNNVPVGVIYRSIQEKKGARKDPVEAVPKTGEDPVKSDPKPKVGGDKPTGGRERYLKAVEELKALKGPLYLPTPAANAEAIRKKEAEIERLLKDAY